MTLSFTTTCRFIPALWKMANEINKNQFSVRWTGQIQAVTTGNYTFYTRTDDAVHLRVKSQRQVIGGQEQVIAVWSNVMRIVACHLQVVDEVVQSNQRVADAVLRLEMRIATV